MNIITFGKRLKLLRHQQGWSQQEVAVQLGISVPAYSKIETGITDINFSRVKELAELYHLTVIQLLTYSAETPVKEQNELEKTKAKLTAHEAELITLQQKVI